ncbi:MAG: twin-arginine translocation signal domain-containing protein [Verrucomicrobia bacterium]|jgi:hypothetical protein|nr:twin-arginine translocation signal domain-containing protein [Verrucomicrobiota bacterium]MBT7067684.1 twin-arginine translocation signal domain-containing protein [Verrucomicrobiota bacterium]MBT7699785.1 twin-arginine translocation signal domain-containing protein [Verrucomicrobiota bacterium]
MQRRKFLKTTTAMAAALAAQGNLPLLAARKRKKGYSGPQNCFTEPCAIEPITGHLPTFSPAAAGRMRGAFTARYALVICGGSAQKSRNGTSGSLDVSFAKGQCRTLETREGQARTPGNTVKTTVQVAGELSTASKWTLESSVGERKDLGFVEKGEWDGKTMTVQSSAWKQQHLTTHPLIARWALLPLLASGRLKKKPLTFDMLDDSTLRANQTLSYEGEIEVPVKGGTVKLDSYAQTGKGIVPTHYLVDDQGRVQLITMTTVNWALTGV